ncbi:PAS domain S-box protein [Saccharopolyspora sp. TS4A08]|uniref:PAS domain S-box protein n=1 Tax=Saccharopolyspora ipomoeae TaxID=3042027 RepID=A0ABT6PJ50_9PSEU|nr:PAS domain S-box protein [Saccharopolyspora sp. TS4A08]MDI2027984.1 PAS domain S-box protein [Saccharopolyspora sp. TS4A08]
MNEHATAAVIVADRSGTIVHLNDIAEDLFGHPRTEALGASLDLIVPGDYRQAHWAGFHRAMDTGESGLEGTAVHLPVVCHDGQIRVFPGMFSVLRDPHGLALGAAATYTTARTGAQPFTPLDVPAQQERPGTG